MTISLGAGCTAHLRWSGPTLQIEVRSPSGRVSRRLRGTWSLSAVRASDPEVRRIVGAAVRSGRAPAFATERP